MSLTLKEKLEHGDFDHFLSRDEVNELLELLDTDADEFRDGIYDEGWVHGQMEGFDDGRDLGEREENERIKDGYIEMREHRTEKDIKELLIELDKYFDYTPPKPVLRIV